MERRAILMSLGLSGLFMFLVWQYLTSQDKAFEDLYGKETASVMVVASRDILQFETIRPTDIETITVPKVATPEGLISNPKDVIDAVAAIPIAKGEHVLDNKIISKNIYSGLDTQIALGKRGISIPVNVKSALGYNLRPGNRVDLAAHFEYKAGPTNISEVKVFLQDILVLASGRTIQTNPPRAVDQDIVRMVMGQFNIHDPKEVQESLQHAKMEPLFNTVTLEVTPTQAQVVVYVMTVFPDALTLMLRHSDDRTLNRKGTVNLADVMGPDSYMLRAKKLPPPPRVPRVKYFDLVGGEQSAVRGD